jgi:hypothetical protein
MANAIRTVCRGSAVAFLIAAGLHLTQSVDAATKSAARGFNTRQLIDFVDDQSAGRNLSDAVAAIDESGAGVHRLAVYWADIQPNSPSDWDWGRYDTVIGQLQAKGLRVILNPVGSPNWARIAQRQNGNPLAHPSLVFVRNGYWNTFIRTLAERSPSALAFEIWNEENSQPFWDPTPTRHAPNPRQWTDLFCRAATEIRSVRPGALVGVGGFAPYTQTRLPRQYQASAFLRAAYAAGLTDCGVSFVGFHPYVINAYCAGNDPAFAQTGTIRELNRVHAVAIAHNRTLEIWNTEWGFPSHSFRVSATRTCGYSPQRQAALIRREHNYLATLPYVRFSIYFNVRDDGNAPPCGTSTLPFATIGMQTCRWDPKPSFTVWKSLP